MATIDNRSTLPSGTLLIVLDSATGRAKVALVTGDELQLKEDDALPEAELLARHHVNQSSENAPADDLMRRVGLYVTALLLLDGDPNFSIAFLSGTWGEA